jgi:hypothetical protein
MPPPQRLSPQRISADDIRTIIDRAQRAKREADERAHQVRAEQKRRETPLQHLLSAWGYTWSCGRTSDPSNWVDTLYLLLKTMAPYVQPSFLSELPVRGEARLVLLHVCGLVQAGDTGGAQRVLGEALDSALAPGLWRDLCRRFPEDVSRLLPEDLR